MNCTTSSESKLLEAAYFGKIDIVKKLLAEGVDINTKNEQGQTPLQYTMNIEMINFLIENGADVNTNDVYGNTPLHDAAIYDYFEIAETLIKHGIDVNKQNNVGETSLHCAYKYLNLKIADLLIQNGADVNIKNDKGLTPLDIKHQEELNDKLLKSVVDDDIDLAKQLIESGANVNWWACGCFSPLYKAKSSAMTELLISHGADVNSTNDDGEEPLYWAVCDNRVDVAEVLLKHGANVNNFDYAGCFALGSAHTIEMAKLLIEHGANVNAQTPGKSYGVLHYVTSPELAEFFISQGANVNAVSDDGTPLDCAKTPEIAELLKKYGAK